MWLELLLGLVTHPGYDFPLPTGHRFPATKFSQLMTILAQDGVLKGFTQYQPGALTAKDLSVVHCPIYVSSFLNGTLSAEAMRVLGLNWSEELRNRSLLVPAGTLKAARLALIDGIACHAAGGTHHAHYNHGAGYCVFNDLAYAARQLVNEAIVEQVLIFDCDVHQGDGTAQIFASDDRIFTCSLHCRSNYPTRRALSDLDVEIEIGTGDDAYLKILEDTLILIKDRGLQPDLVLYDAGVDVHVDDSLGRLALSNAGIRARDEMVIRHFRGQNCAVATVIGGGYGPNIEELALRHSQVFRAALAVEGAIGDRLMIENLAQE